MKAVIQRVKEAHVSIAGTVTGQIGAGLLILLGVHEEDTLEDLEWIVTKVLAMRIFNDDAGKMNLSIQDKNGEVLVVSQFTLYASTKKGNRPSFIQAARPEKAIPLYEQFVKRCAELLGKPVPTGRFGADMQVMLVNDGPVTITIDSRDKV